MTQQLALFAPKPRARRRDPATSHAAAARAESFSARHTAKIWTALRDRGPGNKDDIAGWTGLDAVAVARRGREMQKAGLVTIGPEVKQGSRIWRAR